MRAGIPAAESLTEIQRRLDLAKSAFNVAYAQGDYAQALSQALQAAALAPAIAGPWSDVAVCQVYLQAWDAAIEAALKAVALEPDNMSALDALAHAYGAKKHWAEVRRWGLAALQLRDRRFGQNLVPHHLAPKLPPPPSVATRQRNLIAFSLFGNRAKYCETAVLNAMVQPAIYPGWTCLFLVDDSVPQAVLRRLLEHGALVERVSSDIAQRWPGPMWRFLAYDRYGLHRVIFRDADSVISQREAAAVQAWVESGALFHMMRDAPTHTELMMAGCWGMVAGAMPLMQTLVSRFLSKPVSSTHFADQYFLREYVWPHARQSLMQHDSMFGFMEAMPFPDGPQPADWHVGHAEGAAAEMSIAADYPDGTPVTWTLYRRLSQGEEAICTYPGIVYDGSVRDHLPKRLADQLMNNELLIRVLPN